MKSTTDNEEVQNNDVGCLQILIVNRATKKIVVDVFLLLNTKIIHIYLGNVRLTEEKSVTFFPSCLNGLVQHES